MRLLMALTTNAVTNNSYFGGHTMHASKQLVRRGSLIALIVAIPLLLLFIALKFVSYEQQTSTKHIDVAVVDLDQPAQFQGQAVALGEGVESQLKRSKEVTWHLVSAKQADAGLKNGAYLMKVTLPEDFSQNATTALSKAPKQSTIGLDMSAHNNFTSHMITGIVADKLQAQVAAKVQEAYNKSLLDSFSQLASGIGEAAAGTDQLKAGADQLEDGSGQVSDGLTTLAGKSGTLQDGVTKLADGGQQLNDGLQTIVANNATLTGGVAKLQGAIQQMIPGNDYLHEQLQLASTKIEKQLASGAPKLKELDEGLTALQSGVSQITAGINAKSNDDLSAAITADMTATGTSLQAAGANFLKAGDDLTQLKSIMNELMADKDVMAVILKNHMASGLKLLTLQPDIEKNMNAGKTNLEAAGAKLQKTGGELTTLSASTAKLKAALNQLNDQVPTLTAGTRQAITQLKAGLEDVDDGLTKKGTTIETKGAIQGSGEISDGLKQILAGLKGTDTNAGLIDGLAQYTDGVAQAASGATQLDTGLGQLNGQVPALVDGVAKLNDGAGQVASGTSQLAAGVTQLNVKLGDGAKQTSGLYTGKANVAHFVTPIANKTQSDPLAKPLLDVLSPMVLLLVAFVAALLTELGFNRYSASFKKANLLQRSLWIAGTLVVSALGITLVVLGMGISVASAVGLFLLLLIAEALFTLIIFALDVWLGTVGVLLSLAILFLQLIVSGGLLPNAMLSGFYQFLGKLMPGTYLLDGLNAAVNGLNTMSVVTIVVLAVMAAIFAGLLALHQKRTQVTE